MKFLAVIFGVLWALVSACSNAAPIYQWRDVNGNVHFSDQPPQQIANVEQTPLQTEMPGGGAYVEHPYSIQKQVEFFQAQQERQQQMRLEELRARQAMNEGVRQANPVLMPPFDSIPPIVPIPRYQPIYSLPQPYRPPHSHGRDSYLRYIHQGDHHQLHLNLGFYNRLSPELYYRLRRWNY